MLARFVEGRKDCPALEPPAELGSLTILDVALAASPAEHVEIVRRWSAQVWEAWRPQHDRIRELAEAVRR